MYDLIIRGGTIVDGSGAPSYQADLAVRDGIIAAIGKLDGEQAREEISAEGLIIAPGFIDIHSHDDLYVLENRAMEAKIRQGITSTVIGNCGFGLYPVSSATYPLFRQYVDSLFGKPEVDVPFAGLAEFFAELTKRGSTLNVASLVAHGVIRIAAMGFEQREPNEAEMECMRQHIRDALRSGAVGMSMGLIYPPGAYSDEEELTELSRVVAEEGGIITCHMRNESAYLLESVEEILSVASHAKVPLEISHLKACGRPNFGKSKQILQRISQARREGIDVTFDQYPYPAGSTTATTLMPPWTLEGGVERMLERLSEPESRKRIREELLDGIQGSPWETMWRLIGWENIVVCAVETEKNLPYEGKHIAEISTQWGMAEVDCFLQLVEEEQGQIILVMFQQDENDLEAIMVHDLQMFGTDGLPIRGKKAHPRLYGTYPRVLGTYVREKGLFSLERAVYKMTFLPSNRLGLLDRGLLRPGMAADITLFDAQTVEDLATFQEPNVYPKGIHTVIVNGTPVLIDGCLSGQLPGKPLIRTTK